MCFVYQTNNLSCHDLTALAVAVLYYIYMWKNMMLLKLMRLMNDGIKRAPAIFHTKRSKIKN